MGRVLIGLLLVAASAAGVGLWLFPDVYSQPDPGPTLYAGACKKYGAESPACKACRDKGYDTCDRLKTQTGSIADDLSADCNAMSIEALRTMVDKYKARTDKLMSASGNAEKDQEILKGFADGRIKESTACPYMEKRIRELQTGDSDDATGTLKRLASCLNERADDALKKSQAKNYHAALHRDARELYNILIKTQLISEEMGKLSKENDVTFTKFKSEFDSVCKKS